MSNRMGFITVLIKRVRADGVTDPWEMADAVIKLWRLYLSANAPELGSEPDEDEVFAVALKLEDGW